MSTSEIFNQTENNNLGTGLKAKGTLQTVVGNTAFFDTQSAFLDEFMQGIADCSDRIMFLKSVSHLLKNVFGLSHFAVLLVSADKLFLSPLSANEESGNNQLAHTDILLPSQMRLEKEEYSRMISFDGPKYYAIEHAARSIDAPEFFRKRQHYGIVETVSIRLQLNNGKLAVLILDSAKMGKLNQQINPSLISVSYIIAAVLSNILGREDIKKLHEEKHTMISFGNLIAEINNKNDLAIAINQILKDSQLSKDYLIRIISNDKRTTETYLFDPQASFLGHPELPQLTGKKYPIIDGITDKVLTSDVPLIFEVSKLLAMKPMPDNVNFLPKIGIEQIIGTALRFNGKNLGVLWIDPLTINLELLKSLCGYISVALSNIISNDSLKTGGSTIDPQQIQHLNQVGTTASGTSPEQSFPEIIGASEAMRETFYLMKKVAPANSTVLILGETGTGKELIAKGIHIASPRKNYPLIKVNCAALPPNLIESELFGHEKGSFTGATERRIGKFELAHNGTLFLDEIGEMPIGLQVKLLRALQEREIERVGGREMIKVNVRIITATNKDLEKEVAEGRFRSDLFFRLNVFPIILPPLRKRAEDIIRLTNFFAERYAQNCGKKISGITKRVLAELSSYSWPGNVRELEHLIERSVLLMTGNVLKTICLPSEDRHTKKVLGLPEDESIKTIEEIEREHIIKVLVKCKGKVSGFNGAASLLGVPPSTLNSKIEKLGISKNDFIVPE